MKNHIRVSLNYCMCSIVVLLSALMISTNLVHAQYDSIKAFRGEVTLSNSDDCMVSIVEHINITSSVFGVTSFERKIPSPHPTKYVWVHSVNAVMTAVPPTGFKISGLKVFKIDVQSTTDYQTVVINFSALDSIPKSTLLSLELSYKMLGPLGFQKNTTGHDKAIIDIPVQFSIPAEVVTMRYHYLNGLSSTAVVPFLKSNLKTLALNYTTPSNNTIVFSTYLSANEIFRSGFYFDSIPFTLCYIPYNLMEGWLVGAIIGSSLIIPVVFFTLCVILSLIRHFTVHKKAGPGLLEAHRV